MSVAAILERAGLVPIVPTAPQRTGTAPAPAAQRVPVVPSVPSKNSKDAAEPAEPPHLDHATVDEARAMLRALAERFGIDPAHVERVRAAVLALWVAIPVEALPAYLRDLDDNATRQAGRVPAGDTAPILCARCGPVWAHPSIAAALPKVAGWPRALGCPWCHVRNAGGYLPRPPVQCEGCGHFTADPMNPSAGLGTCNTGQGMRYPMQRHRCTSFQPDKESTR